MSVTIRFTQKQLANPEFNMIAIIEAECAKQGFALEYERRLLNRIEFKHKGSVVEITVHPLKPLMIDEEG